MKLPLTDQEIAWAQRMKLKRKIEPRRGPEGKQCRHCAHGVAHQFTDKLFYCGYGPKLIKTQRTWTCPDWASRKEVQP